MKFPENLAILCEYNEKDGKYLMDRFADRSNSLKKANESNLKDIILKLQLSQFWNYLRNDKSVDGVDVNQIVDRLSLIELTGSSFDRELELLDRCVCFSSSRLTKLLEISLQKTMNASSYYQS